MMEKGLVGEHQQVLAGLWRRAWLENVCNGLQVFGEGLGWRTSASVCRSLEKGLVGERLQLSAGLWRRPWLENICNCVQVFAFFSPDLSAKVQGQRV